VIFLALKPKLRKEISGVIISKKINRRPDSFESADARAALPQNCSPNKVNRLSPGVNSTSVPAQSTKVLSQGLFLPLLGRNLEFSDLYAVSAFGFGAIQRGICRLH
jgi:hypothetical protein